LRDQLATLFRLNPPEGSATTPGTFWGVNKQGQFKGLIGGDSTGNSVELALTGGLKISIGGTYQMLMNGHVELGTRSHHSLHLLSEQGAVKIFGGGPLKSQEGVVEASLGSGRGAGDTPAVDIEARTNMRLKAEKQILVKGGDIAIEASTTRMWGHDAVEITGTKASVTAENYLLNVGGKSVESYMGPKNAMPSNFPLHERVYAPTLPGVAERVTYMQGDREEEFKLGSHNTHVVVGDMSYKLDAGTWRVEAATGSMELGSSGIEGKATVGTVSLTAQAGAASMTGLTSAELVATGGTATVRGSTGVYLGGPIYGQMGSILVSGSLEPFTGLPFATWGLGAAAFNIGP
jgi:phage baseplate assembly protein gpV